MASRVKGCFPNWAHSVFSTLLDLKMKGMVCLIFGGGVDPVLMTIVSQLVGCCFFP